MKVYIVLDSDRRIQAVFDSVEKAERERHYLAGLDEDDIDYLPYGESSVEWSELNRSFTGALR